MGAQDRPSAVEQQDPVGAPSGAYPVGDDDEGAIAFGECLLDLSLRG